MKNFFSFALAAWFALAVQAQAQKPPVILKPPTPAAGDGFGTTVVAFGKNALVGAPGDDSLAIDAGAVYLFEGGSKKLLRAFLNPSPDANDGFGAAIAVAGNFVIIGAPGDDAVALNAGVAYIFDGETGARLATLSNPSALANDGLGNSVAVAGSLVIVGAPFADARAADVGAVDLFDLNTGKQLTRVVNPDTADAFAHFGISVAAIGNNFAVGTPSDGDATISSFGSVSLFDGVSLKLIGNIPNPLRSGPNPTQSSDNGFGQSLAVLGNDLLVGAPFKSSTAAVYRLDAAPGQVLRTYANPTPAVTNWFGFSVAAAGNNVLAGARLDPTKGSQAGIAYLFNGTTGERLKTFLPDSISANDFFGSAVAVAGNDTLIGAPDSTGSGVVYSFQPVLTCRLTIRSPLGGSQTCASSIQVKALVEIIGGVRPFNRDGNVNGVSATFVNDTLFAPISLKLGSNTIIATCTVTDAVGAQVTCADTTTITVFPEFRDVVINEILYDPNYDDPGTERIELKNFGTVAANLDSFALWIRRDTLNSYWAFPKGFTLAPGGLLTVHWLASGANDAGNVFTNTPFDNGDPANAADGFWGNNSADTDDMTLGGVVNANDAPFAIALVQRIAPGTLADFREACRMVDFAPIGGSIPAVDTLADRAGLWNAGEFLKFISEGHSYEFDTAASPPLRTTPGAFTDQSSPSIGFKNVLTPPPSQHLLITEVCVRPAFGEFVEIHNPTKTTISLRDYYLTDNVNLRDNAYTLLAKAATAIADVRVGDFLVKFPDGAEIGPGEYQTVALRAIDFRRRYGQSVNPTYEIVASDPAVPDMTPVKFGPGAPGFDDTDEVVILLRWDGASDLVEDVDYVVWNTPTLVDKTGLGLDGVDGDTTRSYYDNETPDFLQRPATSQAHALLKSWQRRPAPREFGELRAGGNGISGHDETSENLARSFREDAPTPNEASNFFDLEIDSVFFVQEIPPQEHPRNLANGIINPREVIRISIRLRNLGFASTGPLFTVLRSANRFTTIGDDSTSAFRSIAPQDTASSLVSYLFSVVNDSLPRRLKFVLRVVQKSSGDTTGTLNLPKSSGNVAPAISAVHEIFIDEELPAGNVTFESKETCTLKRVRPTVTAPSTREISFKSQLTNTSEFEAAVVTTINVTSSTPHPLVRNVERHLANFGTILQDGGTSNFDSLRYSMQNSFDGQSITFIIRYSWGPVSDRQEFLRTITCLPDSFAVSGRVAFDDHTPIAGATVTYTRPAPSPMGSVFTRNAITNAKGEYSFQLAFNEGQNLPCTISVTGNPPVPLNAVTSSDLGAALPLCDHTMSPTIKYRWIAANVNARIGETLNTVVDGNDCMLIMNKACNPTQMFWPNAWTFVDSLFDVQDATWHLAPEHVTLNMGNYNVTGLNFVGVILGDVDGNRNGVPCPRPMGCVAPAPCPPLGTKEQSVTRK